MDKNSEFYNNPEVMLEEALRTVGVRPCILTAMAVLYDTSIEITRMTTESMKEWLQLAANIQELIQENDEARFTLYDYLDACLNDIYMKWTTIADKINTDIRNGCRTEAFQFLVEKATLKRNNYKKGIS